MARTGRTPSPLVLAVAACTTLALASLAMSSGPTYDSYAWLIWGRDLAHFDFAFSGTGTSWKPLTSLVAAVLSPLGAAAASGWLVVARAGALLAIAMAFRIAWRAAPRQGRLVRGVVAAATLALAEQYLRRAAVGDADGLAAALALLAVDRHLDGRRSHAFWLIVTAALIRIEAWPFVLAYGAWLFVHGRARRQVVAGGLLVPMLWFGGAWIGTGSPFAASSTALRRPIPGSPGAGPHPALSVLSENYALLPLSAWLAIVLGLLIGLRSRRERPVRIAIALAGCALAWTAIVAAMAQRGYPGIPRYLFVGNALTAVVAGIGAAMVATWITQALTIAAARRAFAPAAVAVVCAAFAVGASAQARLLPGDVAAVDKIADMDAGLASAVRQAGGAGRLLRCGVPVTPWYTVTAVDWDLRVNPASVRRSLRRTRPVRFVPGDNGAVWSIHARDCPRLS
jgi:hypothetical protein